MRTDPLTTTEEANRPKTIWVFTPSRTDPKDLEFILVQRQKLLQDAVERVRESALTDHKHHLLFVGPRGCGKTHLVTLIVSRLNDDRDLTDRLRIAWLNEDETCTTLLELLLKIHSALEKRYPNEYRAEMLGEAYDLKPDAAREFVANHLLSSLGSRTLLVVVENLDAIFEGLGDAGQKDFRAFVQEHPRFSLVATAQRLVEDLSNRANPFFGFFQTEHLKPLNFREATELLQNIARLQAKEEVVQFLSTSRGRSRVRALHHLSGGNHRIYIVLSQFITRDSIDSLLGPFMKMVDELTPYYQERIRWLSPLQRKIVEYLCACEGTVPVKEIAKRLFATPPTISSQLQNLREKGYVEANQRGREFLYEISEPLMRICVEVKENQANHPLRLLVDFLRVWYDDQELKNRLGKTEPTSTSCAYLKSAIERNSAEGNLRKRLFFDDFRMSLPETLDPTLRDGFLREMANQSESVLLAVKSVNDGNIAEAIGYLDDAIARESTPLDEPALLLFRAELHSISGDDDKALADYTTVIGLSSAPVALVAKAFYTRGVIYGEAGETQREIDDYTAAIELFGAPIEIIASALVNRGVIHGQSRETQRALEDFTTVIELPQAPVEQVATALVNRGAARGRAGEILRAVEDFTAVIELSSASVERVADALINRALARGQSGETQRAIDDYTSVIGLSGAPTEQIVIALINRGAHFGRVGERQHEIDDYTAVIGLFDAPVEQVAKAHFYRGITYSEIGETQNAIDDYTKVTALTDVTGEEVAKALVNRGAIYGKIGWMQDAINDYTTLIGLSNAPAEPVAKALTNRGIIRSQTGEIPSAIEDFTAAIVLSGAPTEQVAIALFCRGITYSQSTETQRAVEDFTAVTELAGVPAEAVAMALVNRGIILGQAGETQSAIADYAAVIGLSGAPAGAVAQALVHRGLSLLRTGQKKESQSDFETLVRLSGVPMEIEVNSHLLLSVIHFSEGKWSEGFQALEAGLECGAKVQPPYRGNSTDLVETIFSAGLNSAVRGEKVRDLVGIYEKYHALVALGEAMVQHIGNVFRAGEPFPSTDNLEGWVSAWEQAAENVPEFRLSVRLLRTGVNFVKAGGKDRGILLDLTSTERAILEQAFDLAEKDPAKST